MKRSTQPTNISPTTTTTAVSFSPNSLSPPSPYHHHNTLTRSPTRVSPTDVTDDVNDDLFGSAAWKKKRPKRGGKKAAGSGREHDGKNDHLSRSKRWAFVRFVEQQARKVRGHACAVQKWCRDVCEGWRAGDHAGEGEGRGSAVPTAAGESWQVRRKAEEARELTSEGLAEETKRLCEHYIHHRLSTKGLMTKRVAVVTQRGHLADDLCTAGQELERLYPRVFTDISRRIAMTMTSPQLVRRALTSVLEDIFRSGVTWARLVAMVVISAAFAEECVVQGHPNYVEDVVMCVEDVVTSGLSDWLIQQGGWSSFPSCRPPSTVEKSTDKTSAAAAAAAAAAASPYFIAAIIVMGVAIFLALFLLPRFLGVT